MDLHSQGGFLTALEEGTPLAQERRPDVAIRLVIKPVREIDH
jgi:hypothetical protein